MKENLQYFVVNESVVSSMLPCHLSKNLDSLENLCGTQAPLGAPIFAPVCKDRYVVLPVYRVVN